MGFKVIKDSDGWYIHETAPGYPSLSREAAEAKVREHQEKAVDIAQEVFRRTKKQLDDAKERLTAPVRCVQTKQKKERSDT